MFRQRRSCGVSRRRARGRAGLDHLGRELRRPLRLSRLLHRAARSARPEFWAAHLAGGDRACGRAHDRPRRRRRAAGELSQVRVRTRLQQCPLRRRAGVLAPIGGHRAAGGDAVRPDRAGRRDRVSGLPAFVPAPLDRRAGTCRPRAPARRQARRLGRHSPLPPRAQDRSAVRRRSLSRRGGVRRAGGRGGWRGLSRRAAAQSRCSGPRRRARACAGVPDRTDVFRPDPGGGARARVRGDDVRAGIAPDYGLKRERGIIGEGLPHERAFPLFRRGFASAGAHVGLRCAALNPSYGLTRLRRSGASGAIMRHGCN